MKLPFIKFSALQFGFPSTGVPKLGREIYEAIRNDDVVKVKTYNATMKEISSTVESSDMDDDEKTNFISRFSNRWKINGNKNVALVIFLLVRKRKKVTLSIANILRPRHIFLKLLTL